MQFVNSYEDETRARAYARLEFGGTYHLAFRDMPQLIQESVRGRKALDFGCGTGRSSRFLRQLGFDVVGIDISAEMVAKAKEQDPGGDYRLIEDGNFHQLAANTYDLILSSFTFDNIPKEKKSVLLCGLASLLNAEGKLINLVSSPTIYTHEWASFSTKDFPQNREAKNGDVVPIITTDFEDRRPCYDIFCPDKEYQRLFQEAKLREIKRLEPLAKGDEPYRWVSETRIAPWVIYLLEKTAS